MPLTYIIEVAHEDWQKHDFFTFLGDYGTACVHDIADEKRDALEEIWNDHQDCQRAFRELAALQPHLTDRYQAQLAEAVATLEKRVRDLRIPGVKYQK